MITTPTTAACHSAPTPTRFIPLRRTPTASAPITVPMMPPRPFSKDVPPRMTAAIASNSMPMPTNGCAALVRAVMMKEAKAANAPAYT